MVWDRNQKVKKAVFEKTRRVLLLEAQWMAQVRYEFSVGLREEVFAAWIRFVKYRTIKRNSCANRYSLFLLEL
jgi:hypothetical protein